MKSSISNFLAMKLFKFTPLLVIAGALHAQGVMPPPPEADPASGTPVKAAPEKPAPPKAQVIEEDEEPPPVKKAANRSDKKKPTKQAVKPEPEPSVQPEAKSEVSKKNQGAEVKGKPAMLRKAGKPMDASSAPRPNAVMPPMSELTPMTPKVKKPVNEGIQIHVEKFNNQSKTGSGNGVVKITSPWPAKPLDVPPLGWRFIPAPAGVDPYRTTVKLGAKDSVKLAITPYILVPVSDGRNVIRIAEPGYSPKNGYQQEETIGSILQQSTEEIEHNEKLTAAAIQRLQRLLTSLPKP